MKGEDKVFGGERDLERKILCQMKRKDYEIKIN